MPMNADGLSPHRNDCFERLGTGLPGIGIVRDGLSAGWWFRHNAVPGTSAGDAVVHSR